jgi:immune inhibitor A
MFPLGTPLRVVRSAAADRAPLRGPVRVIVVLVQFSDKALTETKEHFEELFFSVGTRPNGSVRDYFREVTNNLIDIVGEVVGPYTLPKTIVQYANGASGTGTAQPNARTMAFDTATASNPDVNFALYDNDSDGFVDAFIVVHAGPGAESTGKTDDIWSHKWVLSGGAFSADSAKIFSYLTVPEDARIGVCCHELGHLLFGFPDLYDIDNSGEGIGNWCLMAGGSWGGGGDTPTHPSAWCKANQGWASVINQTTNANVSIPDVKTSRAVHRLWKDGGSGSEYFLVENRQKAQYDSDLPGEGLLIWHIDEAIATNADESHPKVALMQADGKRDLEKGNNRGDAGDPFPGSANNVSFTASSTPNSKSYGSVNTCVAVTNISPSAATMTARLSVKCTAKLKEVKEFAKEKREKEKEKDFKDFVKDKREKEFKEKEFKEKEFEGKHIVEKQVDKQVEKPITDKSTGFEKPGDKLADKQFDKPADKPGEGGFGFGGAAGQGQQGDLEARLASLEARLTAIEPFIDASLRPDLSQGALAAEDDLGEIQRQMQEGAAQAKRLYDTKPRD